MCQERNTLLQGDFRGGLQPKEEGEADLREEYIEEFI